jgi:hypothetical protein
MWIKRKKVPQFLSRYSVIVLISIMFPEIIVASPYRFHFSSSGDLLHTLQMEHCNKTKHGENNLVIKAMK